MRVPYRVRQQKTVPLKNFCILQWQHVFESNFQTLYVNVRITYPANFIEVIDTVQRIQQFKL